MTVRARFWVTNINHHHVTQPGAVFATVKMAPVYGAENKPWSEATPQGQIEMSITNPDAVAEFELGKKYDITFTAAGD